MTNYSNRAITDPVIDVVLLSLVKKHLAVDHNEDDDLIEKAIKAAWMYSEARTGQVFGSRSFLLELYHWPCGDVRFPDVDTITSVTSVKYPDENGVTQTIDPSNYFVRKTSSPPILRFKTYFYSPTIELDNPVALSIEYVAGGSSPDVLQQAIMLIVGHWQTFPGGMNANDFLSLGVPSSADALLDVLWTGFL